MTACAPETVLTFSEAAAMFLDPVKDQAYRLTPVGAIAGRYLDELEFNNYARKTIESREPILAWLSLHLAAKGIALDEVTTRDLVDWLHNQFKTLAVNSRITHVSTVKVFFDWAHLNDLIPNDPARRIKPPRYKDTDRHAHSRAEVRKLITAQESRRERVGLLLLYWCALRRDELRRIQFQHLNLTDRFVIVHGKGGKIVDQHLPQPAALEVERYLQDRNPEQDEYLLHPQRIGRRGTWPLYSPEVIWQDPRRPYSTSGIDKWWQRCLDRAGLPRFPMHEIRHTAGTHYYETSRDLVATKFYMRHASSATTERIYLHLDHLATVAEVQRQMIDPLRES